MSRSDFDVITGPSMPQLRKPVPQPQRPSRSEEPSAKPPAPRQDAEKPQSSRV
jgi:hypothetical protein